MTFALDEYAGLDSPLHRWDQRMKLVGMMALIFAYSYVREPRVLAAMFAVTAVLHVLSRLPLSYTLRRMEYPGIFLLAVLLILPFASGHTVVATIGALELKREGLLAVALIASRFICILTTGFILFGTAPFLTTVRAMRSLGLPSLMADMVMLTFRYLHEIGSDLQRMQTAMRLRGFKTGGFGVRRLPTFAWLGGSVLVRSYERSESVYRAMLLRGYGEAGSHGIEFNAHRRDVLLLALFLTLATAFVVADVACGHGSASLLQ